jgi:serine phosphatase RsbU (regulator of sigma subunit)
MKLNFKLALFYSILTAACCTIVFLFRNHDLLTIIFASTIAFSVVVSFYLAKAFLKPIHDLTKLAMSDDDDPSTLESQFRENDEIRKLANALINKMKAQRDLNTRLEIQHAEMIAQKEQIEETNLQITDSISYAKRIQNSMLPDIASLKRLVKNSMVYYQPKDIVSGDFYWFERVRKGRSDYLILACADCTGHGVPGAIMSIMGSNLLTNIVYYQNYLDPQKILARLDKAIKFELYRDENKGNSGSRRDGMEIGICVINLEDLKAEFSGVGLPLYMVRDEKLLIYRSIKQMAGGMEGEEREVENQISKEDLQLKEGDKLYLATDGFQDQFGGDEDKKFMAKNFRNLIQEDSQLDMLTQQEKLKSTFVNWKKDTPQTDDVLVLGIEI